MEEKNIKLVNKEGKLIKMISESEAKTLWLYGLASCRLDYENPSLYATY